MKIKYLPLLVVLLLSACRIYPKFKNNATINEKEVDIEVVELFAPKTSYKILKLERVAPIPDTIHHNFGVQYALNYELEFNSCVLNGEDSIDTELIGFQIVKKYKSEYWLELNDIQCNDTILIVPKFKVKKVKGNDNGPVQKATGTIKFRHFGSCKRTYVTIQLGDKTLQTLQVWHK